MVFRTPRRFIAGALCPKCAVMDKLVVFKEDDNTFRECVNCGYREEMEFSPKLKPLPTRVDPVVKRTPEAPAGVERQGEVKLKPDKPELIKIVNLDDKG